MKTYQAMLVATEEVSQRTPKKQLAVAGSEETTGVEEGKGSCAFHFIFSLLLNYFSMSMYYFFTKKEKKKQNKI